MTNGRQAISIFFVLAGILLSSCREQESFYTNVMRSDVFRQDYDNHQYDFLWVFDNSDSMTERREYVKDHMQSFLNILNSRKAIDYQMAMVTTDYFTQSGDLVDDGHGMSVVKSATSSNPAADFASIVNNITDTPTSFWEQGLESAYQAIFKHKDLFSRDGVPLVVIFLTDENDWSCQNNCYGVEPEHNDTWVPFSVERYINYFKNVKSADNSRVEVFPLVGLNTTDCEIASSGERYMQLATALSGVSGSICDSSLSTSYSNIARTIADRGVRFPLSFQASGKALHVYVSGQEIPFSPDNYVYEESTNSIVFTGAIPRSGELIEVSYAERMP